MHSARPRGCQDRLCLSRLRSESGCIPEELANTAVQQVEAAWFRHDPVLAQRQHVLVDDDEDDVLVAPADAVRSISLRDGGRNVTCDVGGECIEQGALDGIAEF